MVRNLWGRRPILKFVMAIIEGLLERRLSLDDMHGAVALSKEAGWNQTDRDWQLMLAHGRGFGLETETGQLVATALTLSYGNRLAWISMVLVTGAFRKKGLATHLLKTCIDSLSSQSTLPLLDATEAGRIVYSKIGFKPLYGLRRMIRKVPGDSGSGQKPLAVRRIETADLPDILRVDHTVFGADRSAVLNHLAERQPDHACMVFQDGDAAGYTMVRDGDHAFHIGPIVADILETAKALTSHLLDRIEGPVYVDTMDHHPDFQSWLENLGFVTQRTFTRMVLGELDSFDQPDRIYAAVGPEMG